MFHGGSCRIYGSALACQQMLLTIDAGSLAIYEFSFNKLQHWMKAGFV